MRKYFSILFLVLTVVAFSGTVSAEATVDVSYTVDDSDTDSSDVEIIHAQVGDLITATLEVQNDANPVDDVEIQACWANAIDWADQGTPQVSLDGGQTWIDDRETIYYGANYFIWDIGSLAANQLVIFQYSDYPITAGFEFFTAGVYEGNTLVDEDDAYLSVTEPVSSITTDVPYLEDTEPTYLTDTEPKPTLAYMDDIPTLDAATVDMQNTGSPVGLLLLAFGIVSAGLAYSKKGKMYS